MVSCCCLINQRICLLQKLVLAQIAIVVSILTKQHRAIPCRRYKNYITTLVPKINVQSNQCVSTVT